MDFDELSLKATSLLRRSGLAGVPRPVLACICALAIVLVVTAALHFWPHPSRDFATTATAATSSSSSTVSETPSSQAASVVVDVEGAVAKPGLYTLSEGARVRDAIEAAGGFSQDAAQAGTNLAAKVSDGDQVYVPSVKDAEQEAADTPQVSGQAAPAKGSNGKININTASVEELQQLSGIGPSLAQRIIDYRKTNGRFGSIEHLKKVSGIGDTRYANLKDKICI